MSGKEGAPVKTIADGQVLFADWLKGFGWVIVVDHGKGFMSLYGHSQALLKDVGDKVKAGEQIALVGQAVDNQILVYTLKYGIREER